MNLRFVEVFLPMNQLQRGKLELIFACAVVAPAPSAGVVPVNRP